MESSLSMVQWKEEEDNQRESLFRGRRAVIMLSVLSLFLLLLVVLLLPTLALVLLVVVVLDVGFRHMLFVCLLFWSFNSQ